VGIRSNHKADGKGDGNQMQMFMGIEYSIGHEAKIVATGEAHDTTSTLHQRKTKHTRVAKATRHNDTTQQRNVEQSKQLSPRTEYIHQQHTHDQHLEGEPAPTLTLTLRKMQT
jgi:hypothetical protein